MDNTSTNILDPPELISMVMLDAETCQFSNILNWNVFLYLIFFLQSSITSFYAGSVALGPMNFGYPSKCCFQGRAVQADEIFFDGGFGFIGVYKNGRAGANLMKLFMAVIYKFS